MNSPTAVERALIAASLTVFLTFVGGTVGLHLTPLVVTIAVALACCGALFLRPMKRFEWRSVLPSVASCSVIAVVAVASAVWPDHQVSSATAIDHVTVSVVGHHLVVEGHILRTGTREAVSVTLDELGGKYHHTLRERGNTFTFTVPTGSKHPCRQLFHVSVNGLTMGPFACVLPK